MKILRPKKQNEKNKVLRMITKKDVDSISLQVTQTNNMFVYETNLSLNENKIVYAIISRVLQHDEKIPWCLIKTEDLCELCKFDKHNISRMLKEISRTILHKVFFVPNYPLRYPDGSFSREDVMIHWIDAFSYNKEKGIWFIHLSPLMKPFLLNLRKNFTSETFSAFVDYESLLGFRLHGIFTKEFDRRTSKFSAWRKLYYEMQVTLSIADLRGFAQAKESYKLYGNFKQRILLPAIKEINKLHHFSVELIEIKSGERNLRVEKILFVVKLGKANKRYHAAKEITMRNARQDLTAPDCVEIKPLCLADLQDIYISEFGCSRREWALLKTQTNEKLTDILRDIKSKMKEARLTSQQTKTIGKEFLAYEISKLKKVAKETKKIQNNDWWETV